MSANPYIEADNLLRTNTLPFGYLPPPAAKLLIRKLGGDIRDAHLHRGLPSSIVAERARIARSAHHMVEKGNPGVSIGIYAAVLQALNLMDGLMDITDAKNDPQGALSALERLPKRAVLTRRKPSSDNRPAKRAREACPPQRRFLPMPPHPIFRLLIRIAHPQRRLVTNRISVRLFIPFALFRRKMITCSR